MVNVLVYGGVMFGIQSSIGTRTSPSPGVTCQLARYVWLAMTFSPLLGRRSSARTLSIHQAITTHAFAIFYRQTDINRRMGQEGGGAALYIMPEEIQALPRTRSRPDLITHIKAEWPNSQPLVCEVLRLRSAGKPRIRCRQR